MPDQTILSAQLAKRLAEAADGYRDSKFYYFVCRQQYDFDLHATTGYPSSEDASVAANNLLQELNVQGAIPEYYKFGPYNTAADNSPSFDYDEIEVCFKSSGTVIYSETLSADTDTIVFNLSAFDKFMLSYYTRLYGVSIAQLMRENAITTFSQNPVNLPSQSGSQPVSLNVSASSILVIHKYRTLSTGT